MSTKYVSNLSCFYLEVSGDKTHFFDEVDTLDDVYIGRVFTTTIVSLNIPEGVLFTDLVKRLKNDRCFHELN